jgi:ubiquinone/menaquinone biosynthesis C-methylase UbiE
MPGTVGLDRLKRAGTDVICDLEVGIPLVDNSAEHVRAESLLEHIDELEHLLSEVARVLRPGGTLYACVPHWSNPFSFSDYTHRRWFGLSTFDYFADVQDQMYRRVPVYSTVRFQAASLRLIFKSPFRLITWLLKGLQWVINRRRGLQLFYEAHLAHLVPCYAIEVVLRPKE